jgi:hypothetical protein
MSDYLDMTHYHIQIHLVLILLTVQNLNGNSFSECLSLTKDLNGLWALYVVNISYQTHFILKNIIYKITTAELASPITVHSFISCST